MYYINMNSDEKRDKRYQISSQLDTIFPTIDISIFVESESQHPD